jgi:hypothetical protein
MLAYTAADSLNAITRTYGVGSQPTIVDRLKPATQGSTSPSVLRSLYHRTLGRALAPRRS